MMLILGGRAAVLSETDGHMLRGPRFLKFLLSRKAGEPETGFTFPGNARTPLKEEVAATDPCVLLVVHLAKFPPPPEWAVYTTHSI